VLLFDSILTDFNENLLRSKRVVIAVFYATYCPFCSQFSNIFEKYSANSMFFFSKADITGDNNPYWEKFHIETVPTLIAFKDNREVARKDSLLGVGLSEIDLIKFLDSVRKFI